MRKVFFKLKFLIKMILIVIHNKFSGIFLNLNPTSKSKVIRLYLLLVSMVSYGKLSVLFCGSYLLKILLPWGNLYGAKIYK